MKLIIEIDEEKYRHITEMPNVYGSEICEVIRNGTPITELSDNIFANILLSEINKKGLAFEEVLLLIDNALPVEITEEMAINKLHETGWLIGHDKEMTTRPQGEWKTIEGIDGDDYYECSNCGEPWVLMAGTPKDNNMNFCPNCGADMKGGSEE